MLTLSESSDDRRLMFDMDQLNSLGYGSTLVKTATLKIKLRQKNMFVYSSRLSLSQNIDDDTSTVVDTVDITTTSDQLFSVSFDVTDVVQAWIIDRKTQTGLTLNTDEFEIVRDEGEDCAIIVDAEFSLTRQRRSILPEYFDLEEESDDPQDCSATENKCCKDNMIVNFDEMEGFEFIVEPRQFNAYMCRGRCPARYKPLNDHSLLQSLLHIKQQKNLEQEDSVKVKRPCCVPSKLSSLPILHLDENDPSKLKVTLWHNIIVTECACA